MKKLIAMLLVLVMALGLAACGDSGKTQDTAEGALAALLNDYKAGKDVNDYFTEDGVETDLLEDEEMGDFVKLIRGLSEKLDYTIEGSTESGDEAVVTVSITNSDTTPVIGDFLADYMAAALAEVFANMGSGEELAEERIAEIATEVTRTMEDKYKNTNDLDTFTVEVEVAMVKDDGKWLVDSDERDALTNAMMGFEESGLESVFGNW